MSASSSSLKSSTFTFWVLTVFLVIVFLTGGTSRADAQSLLVLRPLSVVACAVGLLTIVPGHFAGRKGLFVGFGSIVLLCVLHLIPMPPGLWQSFPGREIVVEVDRLAELRDVWRPLTLTPMNGWHALFSLATPLAVLMLGVQLGKEDLNKLLPVLMLLGAASGLLGMLQVIGDPKGPLYFYPVTHEGSAVGLFANRNHAAVLLACLFPMLATYASIEAKSVDQLRIRQLVAIATGIVLIPLILVTGSRSGILILPLALVSAALLYRKPAATRLGRRQVARFKFGSGHVIAAAVVISLLLLTVFFSRAEAVDRLFGQSAAEDGRARYWQVGIPLIWTYFPFGSGIGSFVEVYQIEEPRNFLRATYVNHLHNDWLEILLTGGLPAAIILVTTLTAYLSRVIALWKRKDVDRRAVKMAQLASLTIAILALASITDYPLRTPTMMAIFAVFCLWFTMPATDEAGKGNGADGER